MLSQMVALSMADGYARLTNKPQCVIVHVDVGTQGLGAAVHNASCGRAPILIFAGLSPYTIEGEYRGSRTEYIHWIQDVPDQKAIVSQYCRYTGEIKRGANVKQLVNRALQFATSDPKGPVYLYGAREAMEEDIEPYQLDQNVWHSVSPAALPTDGVEMIAEHFVKAKTPLMILGYTGRNAASVGAAVALANKVPGLRVLDTGGCDMCFPADHPAYIGMKYGAAPEIESADFILVVDCDVPWIPTRCKPNPEAKIVHIDVGKSLPFSLNLSREEWSPSSGTEDVVVPVFPQSLYLPGFPSNQCTSSSESILLDGFSDQHTQAHNPKRLGSWSATRCLGCLRQRA